MFKYFLFLLCALSLVSCQIVRQDDGTYKAYNEGQKPIVSHWKLVIDGKEYFVDGLDGQADITYYGLSCLKFSGITKCGYSTFELSKITP